MKKTFRKTIQLGIGTLVAQLITLTSIPILTRIYDPETYGFLAVLILATSAILPMVTLKVETLIFTISDEEEVVSLISLTRDFLLITSLCISIIVFGILILVKNLSARISLEYSFYFLIILLSQSSVLLLVQINLYAKKYMNITKSSIYQNLGISIFQIGFGLFRPSITSLIGGFVTGKILGILPLWKLAKTRYVSLWQFSSIKLRKLREMFSKSKKIILGSTLDIAHAFIPTFFIGSMFGAQYSGYTAVVVTILGVPSTFIGGAIGSILLAEFSDIKTSETYRQIRRYLRPFIALSVLYSATLLIFGKELFLVVLGESWKESANLVKFLAIPFAINIFWQPLNSLILKGKDFDLYVLLNSSRFILSSMTLPVSYYLGSTWISIISCFYIVSSLVQLFGIYRLILSRK
jgi:O-antigen/teichoic acid export membrane protein